MPSTGLLADRQRALLAELEVVEALDAQLFARRMELRAEIDEAWNPPGGQEQFGVLEVAGTARIGQTRASTQMINGSRLVQTLPGTLAALRAGTMFSQTALLLLELTRNCADDVVREVERRLLPTILDANTTDVRHLVLRTIPEVEADLEPELTEQRLETARERRSVWVIERPDAMAQVSAEVDAIAARRWALDFEELVRAQKIADDKAGVSRTADQRRADVFAQLPSRFLALLRAVRAGKTEQLLGLAQADPDLVDELTDIAASLPPEREPRDWTELSFLELASTVVGLPVENPMRLNLHLGMTTALEMDNRAGRADGAGALPASVLRTLVPGAELRRVFVDERSGVPVAVDPEVHRPPRGVTAARERLLPLITDYVVAEQAEPRHDPGVRLRELVLLRDQRCVGVGCSHPANRCHLDHEQAYPAGPTAAWNLSAKSARCHRAKHAGWHVHRHGPGPRHGETTWTSPLGRSYTSLSPWLRLPARPARAPDQAAASRSFSSVRSPSQERSMMSSTSSNPSSS